MGDNTVVQQPAQQWTSGRAGLDGQPGHTGDGAFYLRRSDGQGRPVVLELHLGLHAAHAVASVHIYDAPAGHATADLAGCAVRCSVPARGLYEDWLVAGRDDRVVYQALAELEVPDLQPPLPAAAAREISDLTEQVARLQQVIDAAGLNVQVSGEQHARVPRR